MLIQIDLGVGDHPGHRDEALVQVPAADGAQCVSVGVALHRPGGTISETYVHPEPWARAMAERGRPCRYLRSIPNDLIDRILASTVWDAIDGGQRRAMTDAEIHAAGRAVRMAFEEDRSRAAADPAAADRADQAMSSIRNLAPLRRW